MRLRSLLAICALGAALSVMVTACAPASRYVTVDEPRSLSEVESEAAAFDMSPWRDTAAEQTPELRSRALASWRRRESSAALLADVLTSEFSSSRGVPARAEEAVVDGRPVWVVTEAYGAAGGTLDRWRLWVLARPDGTVISYTPYR